MTRASVRRIAAAAAFLVLSAAPGRGETDFAALKEAAERGDVRSQNELGNWYDSRNRPGEAFRWYSKAARAGFAPAQNNVGTCYERGFGVKTDLAEAAAWYEKGARGGDAFAQRNFAALLMEGKGVSRDVAAALGWLEKSAAQENFMGLYDLGICYEIGVADYGVATNVAKIPAVDAEGLSFEVDVPELVMTERVVLRPDEKAALECYRRAQRKGYRPAWWKVGVFAEHGWFCRPDPAYARYCYENAGPNVHQAVEALRRMDAPPPETPSVLDPGEMVGAFVRRLLEDDRSAPASPAADGASKEVSRTPPPEWPPLPPLPSEPQKPEPEFKKPDAGRFGVMPAVPLASARNNTLPAPVPVTEPVAVPPAEAHNRGVAAAARPGGTAEAVRWYRLAAERGFGPSCVNLGRIYYLGEGGIRQDWTEAAKWFRKAAEAGEAVGQHDFGVCLLNGRGVRKDAKEAVKWFRKAADQGYSLAQHSLGACYVNGDGVPRNYFEAVKWFRKAAAQGNDASRDALRQLGAAP